MDSIPGSKFLNNFLYRFFPVDSTRGEKRRLFKKESLKKNKISSLEIQALSFRGVIVLPDPDLK